MSHRRHLAPLRGWDTAFDSGSAASVIDTGTIRITPRMDWNSQWGWFAIRSDRLGGKIPRFLVAKANRYNTPAASETMAVWATSLDTDTWNQFDNQSVGASDIEFYNNSPFPNRTIYIAHYPMYPFSRIGRVFREWIKDTRVTLKYAGQATRRANAGGLTAPGLPFYGLHLTNASGYTKNNLVVCARNHPSETQGSFQLEGAMSWILGGSAEAEFLLDWFNVYVYPCLNPQGALGGYFRSSPEDATKDHNRYWDVDTLESIAAFRAAINTDTSGVVDVGVDFHGSIGAMYTYASLPDNTTTLAVALETEMDVYDPTYYDEALALSTTSVAYLESLGADLATSAELGLLNTKTIANWKTAGQYVLQSITNMHADGRWPNGPGVGSRDFNGSTDRIDWSAVWNPSGSAFTISAMVYMDGNATNSYLLCIHDSGDTSYGLVFNLTNNTQVNLIRRAATVDYIWYKAALVPLTSWHNVIITSDGGLLSGSVSIYLDGASQTISFDNGSGSETAHTGSWSLGGRIYSDTRNFDGKLAQMRVFDRVLTAAEIALEAAGVVTTTSGLKFYFKGNTSSLVATPPTSTGTADGTTSVTGVGNGPSIIYP